VMKFEHRPSLREPTIIRGSAAELSIIERHNGS
jgi:hypothetical protein